MQFVVGGMMVAFGLVGVWLLIDGLRRLVRMAQLIPRTEQAEGVVTSIHQERKAFRGAQRGRRNTIQIHNYPVIAFVTRMGEERSFRSATGDIGYESQYRVGQRLPVRYDPLGEVEPMLDSWAGIWSIPVTQSFAGFVFMGGAAMIWLAFGERILGG